MVSIVLFPWLQALAQPGEITAPTNPFYVLLLGITNILLIIVGYFAKRSLDEVKEIRTLAFKMNGRLIRVETKLRIVEEESD